MTTQRREHLASLQFSMAIVCSAMVAPGSDAVFLSSYDWDELLPAAAMALNNRTATSTGLSPFFFTHGYHLDPVQVKEALRPDGKSPAAKAEGIVKRFQEATEWAQAAMASAQERQEENANARRQPSDQYKPRDKVWLRLRNIRSKRPSKKLDWLAGKYTVLETIGSHACRLETPPGVHNVFHVSLLRLAADDPLPSQTSDDYRPPAILTNDGELWEVEEIQGHKKVGREWKVLVKWVGWVGPTWEPVRLLADTTAVARYEAVHGKVGSAEAPRKGEGGFVMGWARGGSRLSHT
ncbi:Pol [Purpureocillium lilacinum]|uniref:Pol n=1 Tax=Purpureocillium lilacinum TaxID=33203 RepID=A0A179F7P5_PURLI|nr:Pol [Purpureocillium lilacinum]